MSFESISPHFGIQVLEKPDINKAYTKARELECQSLNTPDDVIYSTYAHILKVYRKRRDILNINETNSTEADAFMKLWGEIIEDILGENTRIVKWGESISPNSKIAMRETGVHKKIQGYKVDCRVIALVDEKEHDLLNIEGARNITNKKTINDHLKVPTETRINLDHLIPSCPSANPNNIYMNYLQACGNKLEIGMLRLVYSGLYISEISGELRRAQCSYWRWSIP